MNRVIRDSFIIFCMLILLESVALSKSMHPSNNLVAYENKISHIAYNGIDRSLVVDLQSDPICMYTPRNYQELDYGSVEKTYFFPRTTFSDLHKHAFIEQLHDSLQGSGIDIQMHEITGKNYGLQMTFITQLQAAAPIIKVIDDVRKTVTFYVAKKI